MERRVLVHLRSLTRVSLNLFHLIACVGKSFSSSGCSRRDNLCLTLIVVSDEYPAWPAWVNSLSHISDVSEATLLKWMQLTVVKEGLPEERNNLTFQRMDLGKQSFFHCLLIHKVIFYLWSFASWSLVTCFGLYENPRKGDCMASEVSNMANWMGNFHLR